MGISQPAGPLKEFLVVGDPHVTVEELDDCRALRDLVLAECRKHWYQGVIFLGDLHHNHASVRIEVLDFWRGFFQELETLYAEALVLVGNHDRGHDQNSRVNSVWPYEGSAAVIDTPRVIHDILFVPWCPTHEEFLAAVKDNKRPTVICHQTFTGAKYENGMYASDGIDPDAVPANSIISGHIHTPMTFGRVFYPGAPRWRTAADANVNRAIYRMRFMDGMLLETERVETAGHCRQLVDLDIYENEEFKVPDPKVPYSLVVTLHGTQAWIDGIRPQLPAGTRVRTDVVREKEIRVRESDGIPVALRKYVGAAKPRNQTSNEVLAKLVEERVRL